MTFVKNGTKSGCIKIGEWVSIFVAGSKKERPIMRLELNISELVELKYQYLVYLYSTNAIFCMLARNNVDTIIPAKMFVSAPKWYSFTESISYPDYYTFRIKSLGGWMDGA